MSDALFYKLPYRMSLSIHATKIDDIFFPEIYLYPTTLLKNCILPEIYCVIISKYKIWEEYYVTTNMVVTIRPMTAMNKFIVTAVTTKLVVSAYF